MTYQITAYHQGKLETEYDGIESLTAGDAIDRIIRQHYSDDMLEYKGQLVVIGYEFVARQLGMALS